MGIYDVRNPSSAHCELKVSCLYSLIVYEKLQFF